MSIVICGVSGWLLIDPESPLNRRSALNATKSWACLADFPSTAQEIEIETTGSMITREFTVTFKDSPAAISKWIADCPGPSSVNPTTDPQGWKIYSYPACEGAQHAEVRVSPAGDQAIINTFWS